jgi:carbon monoxide dehydrogenase subunit G
MHRFVHDRNSGRSVASAHEAIGEASSVTVLREVIEVGMPLDDVFEAVADFANAERWDPGVRTARRVHDGAEGMVGVGAEYELEVVFRDRASTMRYVTTRFDFPHEVVLRGDGPKVTAVDTIVCEQIPSGTRVTYTADLRLKGAARVVEPLLRGAFREMGHRAVAGMRAWLEGRAAPSA